MVDLLYDQQLLDSQDELRALLHHKVSSFNDLIRASDQEPKVLKPVLNRYIEWFNRTIVPVAVNSALLTV